MAVADSTRDAILQAARRVLATEGSRAISTRRVARDAGVNQALVHYHFGSIEQLMLDVLRSVSSELRPRTLEAYGIEAPLDVMWKNHLGLILEGEETHRVVKMWLEVVGMVINQPEMLAIYVEESRAPSQQTITAAVRRAMQPSGDPDETEVLRMATLIHVVNAGLMIDRMLGTSEGHAEVIELVASILRDRTGRAGAAS